MNITVQDWLYELLIFVAGLVSGISLATIWLRVSTDNTRRDLRAARRRVLAGIKESHDQEILDEAFRATEALRSELFRSLYRLRASINVIFGTDEEQKPANPVAEEAKQSHQP
jgi:hypothetical protein